MIPWAADRDTLRRVSFQFQRPEWHLCKEDAAPVSTGTPWLTCPPNTVNTVWIAASTATQMNIRVMTKNHGAEKLLPPWKKTWMAVMAEKASVPPSQTGFVTQYRKWQQRYS